MTPFGAADVPEVKHSAQKSSTEGGSAIACSLPSAINCPSASAPAGASLPATRTCSSVDTLSFSPSIVAGASWFGSGAVQITALAFP